MSENIKQRRKKTKRKISCGNTFKWNTFEKATQVGNFDIYYTKAPTAIDS